MSVKKWHQLAKAKSAVDQQTQEIHQKFKMDKINKEFSQLSGEEFFKPITKRLDEKRCDNVEEEEEEEEEEEQEGPDYTMDEFDRTNPFGDEFRPDAPTPATSPSPSPEPTSLPPPTTSPTSPTSPPPPYKKFDGYDFPPPLPSLLMEETSTRKEWGMPGPVEPEYPHESILLQTVNRLITQHGDDPYYKVGKSKLGLKGKNIAELKKIRDGINEKRRVTQKSLSKRLQEGKQRLKSTPLRKRETPQTSFEKAVMSRRPFVKPLDDEEDFPEQDWETEGSGIAYEAGKLIDQLHLSLGSIKAGNNSTKLKKQVSYLLDSLVELGTINEKQKTKITTNYILQ